MRTPRLIVTVGLLTTLAIPVPVLAQAMEAAEAFKVGTFEVDGTPQVGLVLRDRLIVSLEAANRALESDPAFPKVPMPEDMLELIGRYEYVGEVDGVGCEVKHWTEQCHHSPHTDNTEGEPQSHHDGLCQSMRGSSQA